MLRLNAPATTKPLLSIEKFLTPSKKKHNKQQQQQQQQQTLALLK